MYHYCTYPSSCSLCRYRAEVYVARTCRGQRMAQRPNWKGWASNNWGSLRFLKSSFLTISDMKLIVIFNFRNERKWSTPKVLLFCFRFQVWLVRLFVSRVVFVAVYLGFTGWSVRFPRSTIMNVFYFTNDVIYCKERSTRRHNKLIKTRCRANWCEHKTTQTMVMI